MATPKQISTTSAKRSSGSTRAQSAQRYPQWKVDLFRAGMSERRQATSSQISGRAMRAPGA